MHKYNPLELPEIIASIINNISLHDLDKLCWINSTWYKEVQKELRKRCEQQMLKYYEICQEEEREYKKLYKTKSFEIDVHDILKIVIIFNIKKKLLAKEQIMIESCMHNNGMLFGQEKEIVKYNIKTFIKTTDIPWECEKWKDIFADKENE